MLAAAALQLAAAAPVLAQQTAIALGPPGQTRWDAAAQIGWLGANKSKLRTLWDDWYQTAWFGASGGYYWTPNLKVELDVAGTRRGEVIAEPVPLTRRHLFTTTALSAGVAYQFFDNRWFHPFVGVGVEGVREKARDEPYQLYFVPPDPRARVPAPAETRVTYTSRPFVTVGFKGYVSPRWFVRGDLRVAGAWHHADTVVWRAGIGVDF